MLDRVCSGATVAVPVRKNEDVEMAELAELVVPELGESLTEAVVGYWHKQVGERVTADEPIVDLETDKITLQLSAPAPGSLVEQCAAEGAGVKIGDVVGTVALDGVLPVPVGEAAEPPAGPVGAAAGAPAGPVAVPRGLGPAKRRALRETASPSAPVPPRAGGEREEIVPMSPMRRRIAERLLEAQRETASLTSFNEIDMSAVMELRAEHGARFAEVHGAKLGFMSFFVKAVVAALQGCPVLNAEVRGGDIVYKHYYDVGVAIMTDRGLVVPVLRDADRLGFGAIERGIAELAERARTRALTMAELQGATFTITNGGMYGSMMATPLLNPPQTGILGMYNVVRRPVVVGDAIEIRPVMYVALTYDHRVVDGADAAQFLVAVKQRIERPNHLMLDI